MPDSSPASRVSKALSPAQMSRAETFDLFLSELEDDLRKLRENGHPIRSLRQFSGVVKRSYRHACECSRQGAAQVTKVIRCEHGGYLVAMPDGLIKVDSQNPYGNWEKFLLVELEDGGVAIRSDHGRYLAVQADGSVRADAEGPDREAARFDLEEHGSGGLLLATSEGKYLIAMPDGSLRADSQNPDGTWEQFEISDLQKDVILNRKELFEFFDRLSEEAECFTSLTYVVNQWSLGGVVRLKHHSCILAGGGRHLKFDFGRWGVGWSLSEDFPDLPRGTCLKETFDIQASPDTIKQYLLDAKDFSWMSNNCSSFSAGLMRELQVTKPSKLPDLWPTWSRCLATPPVKVPGTGRGRRSVGPWLGPPPRAAGAQEAVAFPKALSPRSGAADADDAAYPDCVAEDVAPRADAQETQIATQVTKVIRCEHGGYLVAMPDGLIKVDSQNPYGDWEQFLLVELEDGRVAIRSDHGRYLAVQADGSVRADAEGPDREAARFDLEEHGSGGLLLATSEGTYLIAMPDGSLRADSQNPDGTWEQFKISDLQKAVGSQTAFVLDAGMGRAVASPKALSPCPRSGAERGLSRSSSTISI